MNIKGSFSCIRDLKDKTKRQKLVCDFTLNHLFIGTDVLYYSIQKTNLFSILLTRIKKNMPHNNTIGQSIYSTKKKQNCLFKTIFLSGSKQILYKIPPFFFCLTPYTLYGWKFVVFDYVFVFVFVRTGHR